MSKNARITAEGKFDYRLYKEVIELMGRANGQ